MILVDTSERSSKSSGYVTEMVSLLTRLGRPAMRQKLSFADFCFEGYGPAGLCYIGIERKTLHDILHCIDDARYAGHQRGGMKLIYKFSFLAIEGLWKPHYPEGHLMEGWEKRGLDGKQQISWGYCKYRTTPPLYTKLFNFLLSVSLSGVPVIISRNMEHTACNLVAVYDYFQKPWHTHTSLLETQVMPLAGVTGRPSLVRRWASQLEGIGVGLSGNVEDVFSTGIQLATADETEWLKISRFSSRMARKAVAEIRGNL
jgi:ERCC4-type nuclease